MIPSSQPSVNLTHAFAGFQAVPEPPLPPEQGRALQGLFFTLAAVEGTEAEQIAGRLIKYGPC
eukprot:1001622-Pelagomonas_calceolata.AAC.5